MRTQEWSAAEVIALLGLQPLPGEGGFFKETYRVSPRLSDGSGTTATAIYYLVTPASFSSLHKLKYDEIFHFYGGQPAQMLLIFPDGKHEIVKIGNDIKNGERPQVIVPAGTWQGTKLMSTEGWSLLGTTMAPAFEFKDLEIGVRAELVERFPHLAQEIANYTYR